MHVALLYRATIRNVQMKSLVSRKQLAEYLNRSPRTLVRWAKEGFGPTPIKVKGTVFYDENEVDEFLDDCKEVAA